MAADDAGPAGDPGVPPMPVPDEIASAFEASRGRGFEEMYAAAADRLDLLPWAELTAHPSLVGWLEEQATRLWPALPEPASSPGVRAGSALPARPTALVVGCGLGDDAAELATRGFNVTAFDFSPTAVQWCRRRFPDAPVEFEVLDLFDAPSALSRTFDLVDEIYTVQTLPPDQHAGGIATIARLVGAGGVLFARCFGRDDDEPATSRPLPLSPAELAGYQAAGLTLVQSEESYNDEGWRVFQRIYRRP